VVASARPRRRQVDNRERRSVPAWADVDRNGCDQRNDVLRRDLTEVQAREGTHGCVVIGGMLDDPYTGATVPFEKADAAQVPIDHVVPLSAAWAA
jgi:hypothetical protein